MSTIRSQARIVCCVHAYVSSLPLLHLGNKMMYLCHYRRAGAYRVGRTRRPHCLLLLLTYGEIENWVKTERSLGSVELSLIGRCVHYYTDSTQLNWTHSQMFRIAELATTGSTELRWVAGCDHSARSDSTQPVELSWVESDRALWSGLYSNCPIHCAKQFPITTQNQNKLINC